MNADEAEHGGGKCPICGKPAQRDNRPFCSKRCADVDLNRWLSGAYAIPSAPDDPGEDDFAASGSGQGRPETL